jgi:cardiolipin synthase (CMP-forming)
VPRWLPNFLTLVRLILAPFVVREIVAGNHVFALELFAIAAVTDILDGAAARRFHIESRAGAYLDPIADKVLMSGVFLALAWSGTVPWWLVYLIFGRDIFILLGACLFLAFTTIRNLPPSVWGKLSTFVQIVTAVGWMGRNALDISIIDIASPWTIWPCAAATAWSGIDYARRGIALWRTRGETPPLQS